MKKKKLNDRQEEVRVFNARYSPKHLISDGAIGSGKTVIMLSCWVAFIWTSRDQGKKFIMTGYTLGSLKRNCLDPLNELFGIEVDLDQENSFTMFGNKVYCFGTDKSDSYKPIRGIMTAYGHYGNEITLSNKQAIEEVFHRCRGEGARFFWETNPTSPENWIYKDFIQEAITNGNNKILARFSYSLYDNAKERGGFLPPDYIERQEKLHAGIFHRQLILGEWCTLEGQIYHLDHLQYYDDSVTAEGRWFVGGIIHGYLDPAAGSMKKTGCYTSIITGCMKDGKIYIFDAVVRKYGVQETISAAGNLLGRYNYQRFSYEDNFTQEEYVGRPLKLAYPFQPIIGQSSREDKLSRLIGMQMTVETKVFFPDRFRSERGSDGWLLLQQLCNITRERDEKVTSDEMFLDAPDALEGLIRTYRNYSGGKISPLMSAGGDDIRKKQEW